MKLQLKELPLMEPLLPTFHKIDDWFPNSGIKWTYEPKFDGVRCFIYWTRTDGISLRGRTEREIRYIPKSFKNQLHELFLSTKQFDNLILDGELLAIDPRHLLGNLQSFQNRMSPTPIALQYRAFDLLYANEKDTRSFILTVRRKLLQKHFTFKGFQLKLTPFSPSVQELPDYIDPKFIVAKNAESTYTAGRQVSWIKLKEREPQRFFVTGFVPGIANLANTFGALKIANEKLEDVGELMNGFSMQDREMIWTWINRHCKDRWRAFAVEIFYSRYTTSGKIHQPYFDKVIFPGEG